MNELPDTLPREYIIKAIHAYDSGFSHRFKEARLYELEFQGFDGNDGLEGHMASYVEFLMSDGKWPELQEQVDNNDAGNSHTLVLDTYMRMVTEHRRIKASRDRGHRLDDYLLSLDELAQIASARVHPSSRA